MEATTNEPLTRDLDLTALKLAIHAIAAELREQKEAIRSTPLPWERDLWADLRRSKARATLLCAIRAHARGRLHMQTCTRSHAHLGLPQIARFTLERQARFIGDRWRAFARAAPAEQVQVQDAAAGAGAGR